MVCFGQLVIGPPGAGKTTYCNGAQQLCAGLQRDVVLVNLDPANDVLPYDVDIDLRDLVTIEAVMAKFKLGPNGALMYAMEYLKENVDWLEEKLQEHGGKYFVFDMPGQVELYCHSFCVAETIRHIQKRLDLRLTVVHLVDSVLCTEAYKYISALLIALSGQVLLELPHVNVLSKIDLLKDCKNDLPFKLEYFCEVQDLSQLLRVMTGNRPNPHPLDRKFGKVAAALCELVEDYNLTAFLPLDVQDKDCMLRVFRQVDTANG